MKLFADKPVIGKILNSNAKALKDIFSNKNNSKVIKGSKEDDGFFIFA